MVRVGFYKLLAVASTGLAVGLCAQWPSHGVRAGASNEPAIVHDVFFALKDSTPENRQKLIESCKKYLTNHEGAEQFSVGAVSDKLKGQFNDREWDVGLHIWFKNKAAHDAYAISDRHTEFVGLVRESMKTVRVFDTAVAR